MKQKLFSLLFAIVASIGTMFAWDYEVVKIGDLYYNLDATNQTAEVTSQNSSYPYWSTTITTANIPASVTYNDAVYSVTSIGEWAFANCTGLTSVTIPNSVTSIGEYAFYYCRGLTSVTIGNSVTSIGQYAFSSCSGLTSVTIPNSVTSIGNNAFRGCSGLTSPVYITHVFAYMPTSYSGAYTIPDGIESIAGGAFQNCSGLTSVTITNSVTSIGDGAFEGCSSLTSIEIPNSVTSIGREAFNNCSGLTSVTIPNSVTSIGVLAFAYCTGLTSVTIPNSVTSIGDLAFSTCTGLTSPVYNAHIFACLPTSYSGAYTIPDGIESIAGGAFSNCTGLTSVTIPNSVTSIGDGAFYYCTGLTSPVYNTHVFAYMPTSYSGAYTIPDGIESIAGSAFMYCTGLTSVTIPNSVTSIGESAFSDCSSLTSVTIPNSVTSIGGSAFSRCSGLTSITCEAVNPPALENAVFNQVDKSIPLYVPAEGVAAYQAAEGWNEFTNIQAIKSSGGDTPMFPNDPGTLVYSLELHAAVVDGDRIAGQAPTGAGGYPAGTEATITARNIPGYEFVQWSDSVTDMTRTIVVNESMTLTALYNHSMIEIPVAANQWNFICLPPLGDRQYTEDLFTYDGLTDVQWGTYNGSKRAEGRSGWETPESFNALQGYILYSTTAGTLKINAYVDDIRQGDSNTISAPLSAYASGHTENANWNFLGNPYSQGFNISAFADAGNESPITVWNGTGYTTYTPGIDDYTLQPFEAFFIQKPEGTGAPETITFIR